MRTGELGSTGMRPFSVSTCFGVNSSFCSLCPSRPYPPSPDQAHTRCKHDAFLLPICSLAACNSRSICKATQGVLLCAFRHCPTITLIEGIDADYLSVDAMRRTLLPRISQRKHCRIHIGDSQLCRPRNWWIQAQRSAVLRKPDPRTEEDVGHMRAWHIACRKLTPGVGSAGGVEREGVVVAAGDRADRFVGKRADDLRRRLRRVHQLHAGCAGRRSSPVGIKLRFANSLYMHHRRKPRYRLQGTISRDWTPKGPAKHCCAHACIKMVCLACQGAFGVSEHIPGASEHVLEVSEHAAIPLRQQLTSMAGGFEAGGIGGATHNP